MRITSFTLVNADTDKDISILIDGYILNTAVLKTRNFNVRASHDAAPGSVVFALDANTRYRVENSAPFALGGNAGSNYNPVTFNNGNHVLKATPYVSTNGGGNAGQPLAVRFTVTDVLPAPTPTPPPVTLPTVTVTATNKNTVEPGLDRGAFTIARTGSTDSSLEVHFTMSGTARNSVDYQPIVTPLTIPIGSASLLVPVIALPDTVDEVAETAIITLQPRPNYTVGSPASATVGVLNNPAPTPTPTPPAPTPTPTPPAPTPTPTPPAPTPTPTPIGSFNFTLSPGQALSSIAPKPGQKVRLTGNWPRVQFPWTGAAGNPIEVFFDGGIVGNSSGIVLDGGSHLYIRGLQVKNVAQSVLQAVGSAVKIYSGTILEDGTLDDCMACALSVFGVGAIVRRVTIRRAGQIGFTTQSASDVRLEKLDVFNCNPGLPNPLWKGWKDSDGIVRAKQIGSLFYVDEDWEAGAQKIVRSTNVKMFDSESAYNVGPGLWPDINNKDILYERCHSHHNRGRNPGAQKDGGHDYAGEGVRLELSKLGGHVVRACNLHHNTGSQIAFVAIQGALVEDSVIASGSQFPCFLLRDDTGRGIPNSNIVTRNNQYSGMLYDRWGTVGHTAVTIEGVAR